MELKPVKYGNESLAFMFESCLMMRTTNFVMDDVVQLDSEYFLVKNILKKYLKFHSVGKN